MIAKEVVQKTRCKTAALRAAAGGYASDGGKEPVGREPAFGNYFFDALCFFAEDQRVLELLRIHPGRIFGKQRNGFIGSNDVRKNAFALQQAGPDVAAVFSIAIFRRQVFAVAGANQRGGVCWNIERLLQVLIVNAFPVSELAQKIQCELAETGEAVGIFVEVAEHIIELGAEIIVASIFGKNQRIEEQTIGIGGQFAEQRAASAGQRFFFDFAKQAKHLLPGAAEDNLLAHLERGDERLRLHHFRLPHSLQRLRLHAALFENPDKLRLQFAAYELEHGQASEHIDRRIAFCLGAIQDGEMNRNEQSFQVGGVRLAQFGGALGGAYEFGLGRGGNVHLEERFHIAEAA